MYWRNLFFSDKDAFVLQRHVFFWISWLLFLVVNQRINVLTMTDYAGPSWGQIVLHFSGFVVLEALFCYAVIYWLLPSFLVKEKYVQFLVLTLGLYVCHIALLLLFIYIKYGIDSFDETIMHTGDILIKETLSGAVPVCLLLVAYKMTKIWYKKDEERASLLIGNANAELMVLKAQVHPHFLFNTLNNIYSFTLDKSPVAGDLLLKLHHILRYMTKECDSSRVPLEKELKMIQDYAELERIRYGKRLQLDIAFDGNVLSKSIAPLLMIPFVENSFKHGASRMLAQPWIKLKVTFDERRLFFHISNSRPMNTMPPGKGGIGLKNVQRRLQLLYPTTHSLDINVNEDSYSVDLAIELNTSS